jgi:hypothetical protein
MTGLSAGCKAAPPPPQNSPEAEFACGRREIARYRRDTLASFRSNAFQ